MQSSILVVDEPTAPPKGAALANWRGEKPEKVALTCALISSIYFFESFGRFYIIMPFRKSCHMPFCKLIPPFTLSGAMLQS